MKFKFKWSVAIYTAICNLPVCFFLCLASSMLGASDLNNGVLTIDFNAINWIYFWINYAVAFVLAMCVGIFIPLTTIGRWFTGLFHVKNDTYTGNVPYRLLATLIITLIYYSVITPTLSLLNYFAFKTVATIGQMFLNMLIQFPFMLLVGFVSSLISDIFAFRVAHKVDPTL